jgi:hypothetical protein
VSQIGNLRVVGLPTASRRNSRLPTCATKEFTGSLALEDWTRSAARNRIGLLTQSLDGETTLSDRSPKIWGGQRYIFGFFDIFVRPESLGVFFRLASALFRNFLDRIHNALERAL